MPFDPRYTQQQKDAVASAHLDRGVPYRRIVAMARAGELKIDGEQVAPFDPNPHSIRDWIRKERKRRAGRAWSPMTDRDPLDAVETLRRRMLSMADAQLRRLEAKQGDPRQGERIKPVSYEEMRQLARAMKEIAGISGPAEARPTVPGQKHNGHQNGGVTTGGMAGQLIAAHKRSSAAPDAQQQQQEEEEAPGSWQE